ncbi:hypothetical protein DFH08DRAFT_942116 [Mycena albidolilacea]|uniref:Uncharacterized protein n=1 Tax=Mycena albidolilacea TaxID=1033008 RepID=A0AAD6ZGB6_9AGAR|nr:hypothetical protein DFH08DRAFT_942116 [Mycena albidolilacea]
MQDTSNSGQFDSAWHFLFNLFAATGAFKISLLLYGIYINLFLLSVYTLSRRRKSPGKNFLLGASCVIAVVATTQMGCSIAQTILTARLIQQIVNAQVGDRPHVVIALKTAQYSLLGINNFATDSLFLYRCYVIWGYQRKILILPAMFMLTTFVVGIWAAPAPDAIKTPIAYSLCAATNLVLTALTAGRISWMRRAAPCFGLDITLHIRCNRAISTILESGAIYCVGIIFLLGSASVKEFDVFLIGISFLSQLLNIIPTFTLVYVGLTDTADESHPESDRKTSSPAVLPWQPTQVLDIKPQGMEEGDYV